MQKASVYDAITATIVESIESGNAAGEWKMPWHTSGITYPINAVSKKRYRGINTLALWATADREGYGSGTWATYRQWQDLDAQVRKGEKSTMVIFWKVTEKETEDDEPEKHFLARSYFVFNADQVNGYIAPEVPTLDTSERVAQAEQFFTTLGATVKHGYGMASYSPKYDEIRMPDFERFKSPAYYYGTRAHETVHWSGHESRLHRDFSGRFGDAAYAFEELVAELGSAFLSAELGLTVEPREDHAVYIAGWLKCLKEDTRAIFTASSKAQVAVDWMKARQSTV